MKNIYRTALIVLFLTTVCTSFAQKIERHHPGKPGARPAIPANSRESGTRNPSAATSADTDTAPLRTQNNGRTGTPQGSSLTTALNYYVRNTEPWSSKSNINAMNSVFGDWSPVTYDDPDLLTIFDPATNFIFLEGSNENPLALNDFLIANLPTIENWVSNGGRLLLNAAPNYGGDMNFGFNGTTLNYSNEQQEVHVVGPLLTNPNVLTTTTYQGSFSRAYITGNDITPLILGMDNDIMVLGEKNYGEGGLVVFGGMTASSIHSPQPDADNLLTNIIYYVANNNVEPSIPKAKIFAPEKSVVIHHTTDFVDMSKGYPTDRTWTIAPATFEYVEGTNEHSNRIKLKFTETGTYTITLKVSNAQGEDEFVENDFVVRNQDKFYWVGGSGNWSEYETHWAKSSGGAEFYDRIPTEDDNIFFDANSFTTDGEIVDLEDNDVFAATANFSGVTHTPELTNGILYLSGSIAAPDPIKFSTWEIRLNSSSAETIDISGVQIRDDEHGVSILGEGSFDIVAPFSNDGYFNVDNGAVTTNGHTISVAGFYLYGPNSATPTIDFENSELHVKTYFGVYRGNVYPFIGNVKLFYGNTIGRYAYFESSGDLTINEMTLIGGTIAFHSDVAIGKLKVMPGTVFSSDNYKKLTVGSIDIQGTADKGIKISNCTINKASGIVVGEYLTLSNVIATGGATFYADKNSIDNGGNNGWIFSTKEGQHITFDQIPKHLGGENFDLTASSSSGLNVTFEVISGPATVSGKTVTITGIGEVTIKASQEGDDNFLPAQDILQSFVVDKMEQTITFTAIAPKTLGDAPFTLSATGGASGNAVTFKVKSGGATVAGNTVTLNAAGPVTITASQAGNDDYQDGVAEQTFCVNPAKPVVTVTGLDTEAPVLTATTADAYQWYNNGAAISGATEKTFSVSTPGIYTVVTSAATCASAPSDAEALIVTGFEAARETLVKIYPNPVVNELIIDVTAINAQNEASVVLYDATGKTLTTTRAKGSVSIPMATYSHGRYTVVVSVGNRRIARNIIKK